MMEQKGMMGQGEMMSSMMDMMNQMSDMMKKMSGMKDASADKMMEDQMICRKGCLRWRGKSRKPH